MDFQGDIGLIGLAVMGENLVMNLAGHHYQVAVFNRTVDKVEKFVNGRGKTPSIAGCRSLPELVRALKRPRRVMMMVRAGTAVDELIDQLLPLLEQGDVVIDGGNNRLAVGAILLFVHPLQIIKSSAVILVRKV